jgi:2,4-dienoyl-CoA reductase (NADPH2)
VIASHRINDPGVARELIASHMCDMVAMGRSLIADPYLPQKARDGRGDEIVHCIACAQGCFDHLFELKHVECMCNPRAGHEADAGPTKAAVSRRIMVVGGGPAGMSAAVSACDRGHRVSLYEKSDRLGGQLRLAAAPPGREEFFSLVKDLESQLALRSIPIALGQEVDQGLIEKEAPDAVILATGAVAMTPPIPGSDRAHVVQAWDVLLGRAATGQRVVVIGGGAVGVETALCLAEKGTLSAEAVKFLLVNQAEDPQVLREMALRGTKDIVVVEMIDKIGRDIGRSTRWGMVQDLSRFGVRTATGAKALEITETGVLAESPDGTVELPADTVVMAAGAVSYNPLQELLRAKEIPFRVVGDAGQIGRAFDAVHQGAAAGREI